MKYDFITIGGATEDITFSVVDYVLLDKKVGNTNKKLLAFAYGDKINIRDTFISFGGGAANAAVSLARLGLKVRTIMAVGADGRGARIIKNLANYRVGTRLIKKMPREISGFSFIVIGRGVEHVGFSSRAANAELKINPRDAKAIKQVKNIYLTSLSGDWQNILDRVFAAKSGRIFWNPGERQLSAGASVLKKYLKKTEVLILNKHEAERLVKIKSTTERDLLLALKRLGPKTVVITNGQYGADALADKNFFHQPIIKPKAKMDTTGVGDAFGSALAAGLLIYHNDLVKALKLAARNGSSVLSQRGAQNGLLSKRDI